MQTPEVIEVIDETPPMNGLEGVKNTPREIKLQ